MSSMELNKTILKNSTNLKAYYRFEAGALTTDSSGNAHTLTAISDPAEGTGVFGGGVDLDADDAYSAVDHADFKPTGNYSMGIRFKSSVTGAFRYTFQSWSSNTNYAGIAMGVNTSNQAYFITGKNTGTTAGHYAEGAGTTNVCDGNWHFIVFTWDGTNLRLWVDGKVENTTAWANAPAYAATNYVRVGCWNGAGTNNLFTNGSLDDVFLLNGTALSADQIKELYEGRTVGEGWAQSGLVGGWHLNGNSTDFSGNNNHGTDTAITYTSTGLKFKQGAVFDGATSFISLGTGISLPGAMTFSGWINPTALEAGATNDFIAGDATAAGGDGQWGIALRENGKIRVTWGNGTTGVTYTTTNIAVTTGVLYYLVITRDAGRNPLIYLNGSILPASFTTGDNTVAVFASPQGTTIGRYGAYNGVYYNGKLDEVCLFNVAKDAAWVRKQYAWSVGKYL